MPNKSNEHLRVLKQSETGYKLRELESAFQRVLDVLEIDTAQDHNTNETAKRMSKMYLHEVCAGRFTDPPKITVFPNVGKADQLVVVKNIELKSMCSHHFAPILGKCHIGYIPKENTLGLSKFARIVDYYARRPQIQEELTSQIFEYLIQILNPSALIVHIEAIHTCMSWRGVNNTSSTTVTSKVSDEVKENQGLKDEFLTSIRS